MQVQDQWAAVLSKPNTLYSPSLLCSLQEAQSKSMILSIIFLTHELFNPNCTLDGERRESVLTGHVLVLRSGLKTKIISCLL